VSAPGCQAHQELAIEQVNSGGEILYRNDGGATMAVKITVSITGAQVGEIDHISYHTHMNVQHTMEEAYNLHGDRAFNFSLQYFGGNLGYEVVTLDNIANQVGSDSGAYVFWVLSVNGTLSPTGIDNTHLNDGDIAEWNYQIFEPARHEGTRHEEIRNVLRVRQR
jgi:Domain of unknown function (DUF4430)